MTTIDENLDVARQELLDLGLRNTLINYRPLKAKGVEITDERPSEVFHILVANGRVMSFLSIPEEEESEEDDTEKYLEQPQEESTEESVAQRHRDDKLQTPYRSAELQKRLLNTFYAARNYIEEQGVNVLFLALGMLQWVETAGSKKVRQAPLILVPVELYRTNIRTRFRIRYTEDEISDNLSLRAKLIADFGLKLPELPESDEPDVEAYFRAVAEAIEPLPQWAVDASAVVVGFFSYGTFLMYNDLDPDNWPQDTGPTEHAILRALLHDRLREPPPAIGDEAHLDKHVAPQEINQVVDADSSQMRAMLDVEQGRNLVIQGPPGTGKSQTITNIIAEALARGKTVLFVAEKMAALEVVKRRLDSVGLGAACLELHSHKTRKKAVLDELRHTLELGRPKTTKSDHDLRALTDSRNYLNAYSAAVNTPAGQSEVTPYRAFGALLQLQERLQGVKTPPLDNRMMHTWSGADFHQRIEHVEELQALLSRMGIPVYHPFWGSRYKAYLPADERLVRQTSATAQKAVQALQRDSAQLAGHLKLLAPDRRAAAEHLVWVAQRALRAPRLEGVRFQADEWYTHAIALQEAVDAGRQITALRQRYDKWLIPEAWQEDVLAIRKALVATGRKWWRFLSLPYRRAQDELAGLARRDLPQDVETQLQLVDAILEVQRLQPVLARHDALLAYLFGTQWHGLSSEWERLHAIATWLIAAHRDVREQVLPAELMAYVSASPDQEKLQDLATAVETGLETHAATVRQAVEQVKLDEKVRFGHKGTLGSQSFTAQIEILETWQAETGRLQEMVSFNHLLDTLTAVDLHAVLKIAATWAEASTHLADLVRRAWYESVIALAMRDRPILATFDGETHQHRIHRFRQLDMRLFQWNRAQLAHQHWQHLPRHEAGGQLGVLQREFAKKRRHLPIRKLMVRAGHAIQTIKPVFMMSPLSIAMFLPPGSVQFDLVVFDEASQVKPVEAFGAILRGKQVVVVGDSRQLPPTSFFSQVMAVDDEFESPTADMESILNLLLAQGAPQRMLRWHYRSRHQSLIAVSNHEFYENRLVTFPSPDNSKEELGLRYHHLAGTVYERGGSRTNPQEAQAVAAAVMEHARRTPHLTLGVVAFSISQTQAIQAEVELLRRKDPSCESFFNAHPDEPFFMKNLENVQGDERDVIFISVGYGRDADGTMTMNFGPLNRDGGERRLNVLITRARRRCEVFTNLTADDIDLSRTDAQGVIALKQYLNYAQTGRLDVAEQSAQEADTLVEKSVAQALQEAGYETVPHVGPAGFYIDLAVVDENRSDHYLLGIECDGPSYHRARSARDRDRLREQVLQSLGWRIHRIWSPDWFRNQERELRRLVTTIEAAKAHAPQQPIAPPAPKIQMPHSNEPVERHDTRPRPTANEARPYEVAQLEVAMDGRGLEEIPRIELATWIRQVVAVESPIHTDEVVRRIAGVAGVNRIVNDVKEMILHAASYAARLGSVQQRGEFLWKRGGLPLREVRDRSRAPRTLRKMEMIAPEEIMLAIEMAIENALGMERENIPLAAARLLGFSRTSEEIRQRLDEAIEQMLAQGRLVAQGGFLLPAKSAQR